MQVFLDANVLWEIGWHDHNVAAERDFIREKVVPLVTADTLNTVVLFQPVNRTTSAGAVQLLVSSHSFAKGRTSLNTTCLVAVIARACLRTAYRPPQAQTCFGRLSVA